MRKVWVSITFILIFFGSGRLLAAQSKLYCASVDELYTMVVEEDSSGHFVAEVFVDGEAVQFGNLAQTSPEGAEQLTLVSTNVADDGFEAIVGEGTAKLNQNTFAGTEFLSEMQCNRYP